LRRTLRVTGDVIVTVLRGSTFPLPELNSAANAAAAMTAIAAAIPVGELAPGEAADLTKIVEGFARIYEKSNLEERVAALERRMLDDEP
jgi:hypothetical protein